MNNKKYYKYDDKWKEKGSKDRAVKFKIDKFPKHIIDFINKNCNEISNWVWDDLNNGSITIDELKNSRFANKLLGTPSLESQLQKKYDPLLPSIKLGYWKLSLIRSVLERYKSYLRRNGELPGNKIKFRNDKSIRIGNSILQDKITHLELRLPGTKPATIEKIYATICGTMYKYRPFIPKGFSGNFIIKDNIYVARAKIPIDWKYEPVGTLGIDINKRPSVFLVLSNGTTIPHTLKLAEIIADMKLTNKEISNSNKKGGLNTKQRKRRRLKLKNLHKKQEKLIFAEIAPILDEVEKNKLLLCIDDAKTGVTNGSYGQDKVIDILVREAENRCIPHVLVPTPHTSQLCHKCNAWGKRETDSEFQCLTCGICDADLNGAKNVANFGEKIWKDGIFDFWPWKKVFGTPPKSVPKKKLTTKKKKIPKVISYAI